MQREQYRIADLTIDVEAVSVLREGGESLPLPRLSFDLLVALARRAPDVVRTDELISTVWAGIAVSDETLTQRVALLRRALGDEAKNPNGPPEAPKSVKAHRKERCDAPRFRRAAPAKSSV